ncbi:MAG: hypothetical protein K0S82_1778, partial [Gaiellaceae bacterium]|nr:hypothetical protein [Gaiellaceae bacterium]
MPPGDGRIPEHYCSRPKEESMTKKDFE